MIVFCMFTAPRVPQDAILDFCGVAVRAQELLSHCSHMKLLYRRVAALAPALPTAATTNAPADVDNRGSGGASACGLDGAAASSPPTQPPAAMSHSGGEDLVPGSDAAQHTHKENNAAAAVTHAAAAAAAASGLRLQITPLVVSRFQLEVFTSVTIPVPRWGKSIGWTPTDDAMLLLGARDCCDCGRH
jgi:hypothetical protein